MPSGRCVVLKSLERQIAAKQREFIRLDLENKRLQQEHALLVGCCDGLQLLRLQHADEQAAHSASIIGGPQSFSHPEELQLLQQLANIPCSNSPAADGDSGGVSSCASPLSTSSSAEQKQLPGHQAAGVAAADPADEQLSPPNDPMHYFRYMISLPPAQIPPQLTAPDLSADYAKTVQRIALQLHLLKPPVSAADPGQEGHFQKLKRAIDRHLHLIVTLALQQRSDMVQKFTLTNFETFEVREELDIGKHAVVVSQIGFTDQQKASIAHGMALFSRLLAPVMQERQQLQQQIAGGSEAAGQNLTHQQWLHLQGKSVDRLTVLMGKEYILRFAVAAWVFGSLTYAQVAHVLVHMTPWPASVSLIGQLVANEVQQQQQQKPKRKKGNEVH